MIEMLDGVNARGQTKKIRCEAAFQIDYFVINACDKKCYHNQSLLYFTIQVDTKTQLGYFFKNLVFNKS